MGVVVSNLRLVFSLGPKLNNTQNCKKLPSTPISHQNWQNGYKLSQPQLNHNITSTVFVCDMKMTLNKLDQVEIRLNQLSTGMKVEAELGNITPLPLITETQCQQHLCCY